MSKHRLQQIEIEDDGLGGFEIRYFGDQILRGDVRKLGPYDTLKLTITGAKHGQPAPLPITYPPRWA